MNRKLMLRQSGFTLVELVMVIVILGILAAFALPRFADMGVDAEKAALESAAGSVKSAVSIVRMKYKAGNDDTAENVTLDDGTVVTVSAEDGYPAAEAASGDDGGIAEAAGLTGDYDVATDGTVTLIDGTNGCSFTYTEADGSVGDVTCN
jgi:MSHA pilin protein MshA